MPRDHARIKTAIWLDPDFLSLSSGAQRLYVIALAQSDLNYCGVVGYTARRWATFARDTTPNQVRRAVDELADHHYIVVDNNTEELWVRSFVKHDGLLGSPNLRKAMRKDFERIHSSGIRQGFLRGLPADVRRDPVPGEKVEPFPEPLPEGLPEPLPEPFPEGSRVRDARADAAAMRATPSPTPPPTPSPSPAAASTSTHDPDAGPPNEAAAGLTSWDDLRRVYGQQVVDAETAAVRREGNARSVFAVVRKRLAKGERAVPADDQRRPPMSTNARPAEEITGACEECGASLYDDGVLCPRCEAKVRA
jgi:hypothetical protein